MATSYSVKFVNDESTKDTWTMAIYQTIPNMGTFDSVSWKQASAPPSGTKTVGWDILYNVALADFLSEGDIGVLTSSQILDTDLGTNWQVVFEKNSQQLLPNESADPPAPAGYINVVNNSGLLANMGIGMSGEGSVYQRNVLSGTKAEFKVTPRYWASLFNSVVIGEVISTAVSVTEAVEVVFGGGMTSITLTAWVEGQTLHFGDRTHQSASVVSTPMSLVETRTRANDEALALFAARYPLLTAGK